MLLEASDYKPGAIGFSHNTGPIARAIRYAERRENGGKEADINHTFALSHKDDNGEWVVIQAELHGVTDYRKLSEVAPTGFYRIHANPVPERTKDFIEFLDAQVTDDYSLLSIASCALDMYLPERFCLRRGGTWICSGLIGAALFFCGWEKLIKTPDLYTNTPSYLESLFP